jgi:glycerophosphoryl diester phosphodiesterase
VGPNAYYFVEVKHPEAAMPAAALIDTYVAKGWNASRLMLISFNHDALWDAHQVYKTLSIGASFEQVSEATIKRAGNIGFSAILPNYRMFKESHMRYARESGLEVFAWTVNDRVDIGRTRMLGVQGIMSDYPDRLIQNG